MPAVSKEQFRKIAQLCKEGKMKKEDCDDYLKKGYFKSLPNRTEAVHYERGQS